MLQSVLEDAQGLKALSNGLLALALSERDKLAVRKGPVRIDEILFLARNETLKNKPECSVEIDFTEIPEQEDYLTVDGHEGMLKTLFSNLLDNACKFSSNKQAQIIISFTENSIQVEITDQGPGISEEELGLIFTPFYRAENVRQLPGHGLGLSICKKVTDLHQGSISISSELGKGSSFTISLPLRKVPALS